jgi:two-component system, chemotaxis family, sensor kinase CheA
MSNMDSMLEIYIYENSQLLENIEGILLSAEKVGSFSHEEVGEIFRVLHTIKGSSDMMGFSELTKLSHAVEDLFAYIREHDSRATDFRVLCDIVFSASDFIKSQIAIIQGGNSPDGDATALLKNISSYNDMLSGRKQPAVAEVQETEVIPEPTEQVSEEEGELYKAKVFFNKGCQMEHVRAYGIINSLKDMCSRIVSIPRDILNDTSREKIAEHGAIFYIKSAESPESLRDKINEAFFIENIEFGPVTESDPGFPEELKVESGAALRDTPAADTAASSVKQSFMSVNVNKLDQLMDLVGEIVITESMVTKNPEIMDLKLDSFDKCSRQLRKLTDELQDIVMSMRMVPVSNVFHKMERIVRDIARKTDKKADMFISGEDTEVDKSILDNLSDPLMHLVRNAMDHGIEPVEEREMAGKEATGRISLKARNTGSEVLITVSDDGRGLDRDALIQAAQKRGLINKPVSEITDQEAYNFIFNAGLSTKSEVTEYSGRGVGMDVVIRNIEKMGGSVSLDSKPGRGTVIYIKIPLTLAIIDGMQVSVGNTVFIIPLLAIRESFKPQLKDVIVSPDGSEMIMIRGKCYTIMRLHKLFGIQTEIEQFENGILVVVETDKQTVCLFVDALLGEQPTVVKPIPAYITRFLRRVKYLAGCTILGNGGISLILDIKGLVA